GIETNTIDIAYTRVNGKLLLMYCYIGMLGRCGTAEYSVEQPYVLQAISVRLDTPLSRTDPISHEEKPIVEYDSGGHPRTIPRHIFALLVEAEERRYVLVARHSAKEPRFAERPRQILDSRVSGYVEPYDRVAEVDRSVESVAITADHEDNITVSWRE